MASLIDTYTMANNVTFINRISQALAITADAVRQEGGGVAEHDRRYAMMLLVIGDVNAYAYRFSRMVAANPSIGSHAPDEDEVPDGDIQFVVSELWNAFTDIHIPAAE